MAHRRKTPKANAQPQPAPTARPSPRRPRGFVLFVGASGIVAAVLIAWLIWGPSAPPVEPETSSPEKTYPEPAFSSTRFLNTGSEAHYVGIDACTKCHRGNHQSYLLTSHSRALADVDPQAEPPDGSFIHPASGRSYRVYRRDGQMRHEEILRTATGQEIARADWPIRYRIGSGHFARTYAVEMDGFLHESPITWYASRKQWDMSPGYDTADHQGFERPIQPVCLACHGGRMESTDTVHRPVLREKAIGCESCHGPGSLHVALHQSGKHKPADEDLTIVNPGKLSRPQLEAICSSCHLQSVARVNLRGRQVGDFRPGMPLGDYCTDYRYDTGSEQMTVVGHMEQLRASVCYQKSKDMTCLTCHNPHARTVPQDPAAFYRQKCLSCHTAQTCKVDQAERVKKNADNCVACHMPRGATDIPHVAFTHHRIGVHAAKPAAANKRIPALVPIEDVAHLTPLDQKRNLGLAYLKATADLECAPFAEEFAERRRKLLVTVHEMGLREADTCGALADLYLPIDPVRSRKYARETLKAKRLPTEVRTHALILLAAGELHEKNYPEATRLLKELVPLRHASDDWGLLGVCYQMQNRPKEALPALKEALSIRPDLEAIHLQIAAVYRQLGDAALAREHQEKALRLSQLRRK